MAQNILDVNYWKSRLERATRGNLHHAVYLCGLDRWQRIEAKHREILARHIKPSDSILDAGCGWGRLLSLLPETWSGHYLGIDLSPDFIHLAQQHYTSESIRFVVEDLRNLSSITQTFDWAILISIRPMIRRHLGDSTWFSIERSLRNVSRQLLFLEYDEDDTGSLT